MAARCLDGEGEDTTEDGEAGEEMNELGTMVGSLMEGTAGGEEAMEENGAEVGLAEAVSRGEAALAEVETVEVENGAEAALAKVKIGAEAEG